jgi:hypothetical protein
VKASERSVEREFLHEQFPEAGFTGEHGGIEFHRSSLKSFSAISRKSDPNGDAKDTIRTYLDVSNSAQPFTEI